MGTFDALTKLGKLQERQLDLKTASMQADLRSRPPADKAARPPADKTAKPLDRKTPLEKAERYTVRLIPSLVKRLKDYAHFNDMNDKDVVTEALTEYLDRKEKDC